MLQCEGYKMFHGTVRITPVIREDGTRWKEPFDLRGTWLYKPEEGGMWYCKADGRRGAESWPEEILSDFREEPEGDA